MRIVNIIQRYPPAVGGSETWCQEVCRYLASRGHEVKVLTMNVNKEEEFWRDPFDEDCTLKMGKLDLDHGVWIRRYQRSLPIYSLHHLVFKRLLDWTFKAYFYGPHSAELYGRMSREMRDADLVFLHTLPFPHNHIAWFVARWMKKRIAIVPHFHPMHPDYDRASNYWLMKHCDVTIADTTFEKEYLQKKGVPEEKIKVAGVGIHPEDYRPTDLENYRVFLGKAYALKPGDNVVTFVGRKMPNKGVGQLIDAARMLIKEMPLKVFLAGPAFEWFKELYASLTPEERKHIIDLGVLSHQDKVNLLHLTDLFALHSRFEAFGIVFLEAWICGVPVLGTTEGAMPTLIGNDGFVSTFGDTKELTSVIRAAFKDKETLREKGLNGKKKVLRRYTWEVVGKQTEDILRANGGQERVLFVSSAYPPNFIGGAEIIAHYQAVALKNLGYDVAAFAGNPDKNSVRHGMNLDRYDGIPVYRVNLHPTDFSSEYGNFWHEKIEDHFESVIEKFNPDIVHFHNIIGLSAGLIHLAKRKGIKTVLTVHDHWGFCLKNTLLKKEGEICADFSRCAECMPVVSDEERFNIPVQLRKDYLAQQMDEVDVIISPSRYLRDAYVRAGFPKNKFRVIWYGIDVERFSRLSNSARGNSVRFTFVGYLGRHKGLHTLIEALKFLPSKSAIRINIVGEGDQLESLQSEVRNLGWEERVKFWGKVDNTRLDLVYRETDVIVLPSIWPENQPVSITEAMAARMPVIASRIGGILELVADGETGYLFEPGDPRDLALKMMALVEGPAKISLLGEKGYTRIQKITFDSQARLISSVYQEELLASNDRTDYNLVACVGTNVQAGLIEQVLSNARRCTDERFRFVMSKWLTNDQEKRVAVFFVVDDGATVEEVFPALVNGIPMIVPRTNQVLVDLSRRANCGLYFQDALEAFEQIRYLVSHPEERVTIGRSGYGMIQEAISTI